MRPGGALEEETWFRGQTIYLPDGNVPLHPIALSEGAASLLPDADAGRRAVDHRPRRRRRHHRRHAERALVRSRAKLDYATVQAEFDAGTAAEPIALLPEIGALLTERGLDRGAINLPLPEQEIEPDGDGYRLVLRAPLPVEEHNAQISLLTGVAAAAIMLAGGVGLLRTMPAPDPAAVDAAARRRARPRRRLAGRRAGGPGDRRRRRRRPARRRLPRPGRRADARCRLHGLRRHRPGAAGARRRGGRLRPRDGPAAPTGRPVRHRGLPGPARRSWRCRSGRARRCRSCPR